MAMVGVSIVIPTLNRPELLKRCLSHLIPYVSAHPECSIIVSDNGNASETREGLAEYLGVVRVVQGPRTSPAAIGIAELLIRLGISSSFSTMTAFQTQTSLPLTRTRSSIIQR